MIVYETLISYVYKIKHGDCLGLMELYDLGELYKKKPNKLPCTVKIY